MKTKGEDMILFDKGSKFNTDTSFISLNGNIDNEFIKRGYSEEESKILANLIINSGIPNDSILNAVQSVYNLSFSIATPCTDCLNNPNNGGSGVCHCVLGQQFINIIK